MIQINLVQATNGRWTATVAGHDDAAGDGASKIDAATDLLSWDCWSVDETLAIAATVLEADLETLARREHYAPGYDRAIRTLVGLVL